MKQFLIVTLVLTVLVSIASTSCSTQEKRLPDSPQTEQLGQVSDKAPNCDTNTVTVAATTAPGSTTQVMEGSLTELYQAPGSNEATNTNPDTEDTDSTLTSPGYRTVAGRVIYRAMLDLLKTNDVVPFHIVEEKGRTYLLFDQGEDISDEQFEKALKTFDRIDSKDITILTDPNVQKVVAYPTDEYYILNGRLFVTGKVILEGEEENDENSEKVFSL